MQVIQTLLRRILGFGPFKEIDPGGSFNDTRFYAIRATGGDLTFTAKTSEGDDLSSTIIQQDTDIVGEFTEISVDGGSAGSAVIYTL